MTPTSLAAGVYARAHRLAANATLGPARAFASHTGTVALTAHPAVTAAVAAHLAYPDQPQTQARPWRVTCVVDPDLWPSVTTGQSIPWAPCLDFGDRGWTAQTPDGPLLLAYPTRAVIAVDPAEQWVRLISHTPGSAFTDSYKTVRSLLTTAALARGAASLHAAAVAVGDRVLAFCGAKGSGKSSALLHLLLSRIPELGYVANDRILLTWAEHGLLAEGWPTVAGFDGGLLSSVNGLDRVLTPELHLRAGGLAYLHLDLPLIEHVGTRADPSSRPAKIRLTPTEIRSAFGVPARPGGGRLSTVVVMDLDRARPASTLVELGEAAVKHAELSRHLEHELSTHPDWLGIRPAHATPGQVTAEQLDGVRMLRLHAGRDYHDVVRGLAANPAAATDPPPRWHHGVYGAALDGEQLLTVRKTRGPYAGLLDLPGGTPEPGEARETTLARELAEETGGQVTVTGPWAAFDVQVAADSDGGPIQFRHHGDWRLVQLRDLTAATPLEDVDGMQWVKTSGWTGREDLSAPVRAVLAALPAYLERL